MTDPNSKGERNTIYYATLEIGNCKVYLENAGTKANSEVTKNQLVEVIQKFLENGELDISTYADTEAGTDLDGNPEGYDPLPNNQTSDEEVSEQDSAASCPATVPLISFSEISITTGILEVKESLYTFARNVAYKTIRIIGVINDERSIPLSLKKSFLFLSINTINVLISDHLPVFFLSL